MNFIFISPNFPENYWNFCAALKRNGVTVFGIGDAPYDNLDNRLRESLTEYYRVNNMEDYDQVYRAVAHFAAKYGRIDWIESNNEYWLEQDARLRTDFNVNTGIKTDKIDSIKEKSEMKKYYAAGGIRTARQIKASDSLDNILKFAYEAGYPLFAKPDIGVGSGGTHKIESEWALREFLNNTPHIHEYVIEEFVTGNICTYDAIINSKGEPMFESMCVCPPSISDIVNYNLDSTYYVQQHINENLRFWGRQTIKAFGVKSRFVHLEFFVLNNDQEGLIEEMQEFDRTLRQLVEYVNAHPKTLLVVTADHETGGVGLDYFGYEAGKPRLNFSTHGHTGTVVPVFAYGAGAEAFAGGMKNTDLPKKIEELIK
mgnify:CR=1 FL=1